MHINLFVKDRLIVDTFSEWKMMLRLVCNNFLAAKKQYFNMMRNVLIEKAQKCDWNGDESNFTIPNSRLNDLVNFLLQ